MSIDLVSFWRHVLCNIDGYVYVENDRLPCDPFECITYLVAKIIGFYCACIFMSDIVGINAAVSEKR